MRIRNTQITPLRFDFWALVASGTIAAVLAAVSGWNQVGLLFLVCAVSGFVNAWRLSTRLKRDSRADQHSSAIPQ